MQHSHKTQYTIRTATDKFANGSLKYHKHQDFEAEVDEIMAKWMARRNDCEQSNCGNQTSKGRDDHEQSGGENATRRPRRWKDEGKRREQTEIQTRWRWPSTVHAKLRKVRNWNWWRQNRREEGGGRRRCRHVEGDVPMCMQHTKEEHNWNEKRTRWAVATEQKVKTAAKHMKKKQKMKSRAHAAAALR